MLNDHDEQGNPLIGPLSFPSRHCNDDMQNPQPALLVHDGHLPTASQYSSVSFAENWAHESDVVVALFTHSNRIHMKTVKNIYLILFNNIIIFNTVLYINLL